MSNTSSDLNLLILDGKGPPQIKGTDDNFMFEGFYRDNKERIIGKSSLKNFSSILRN